MNLKRKMHESTFLLFYSSLSSVSIYALARLDNATELTLERVTESSSKISIERTSLSPVASVTLIEDLSKLCFFKNRRTLSACAAIMFFILSTFVKFLFPIFINFSLIVNFLSYYNGCISKWIFVFHIKHIRPSVFLNINNACKINGFIKLMQLFSTNIIYPFLNLRF